MRFPSLVCALFAVAALADCPPPVSLPRAWTTCATDADCVLAGDGCRTCANFLPVNARHREQANARDARARAAARCTMTCEACAPAMVKLTCEARQCRAQRATPSL
jgi:hypothetical protein